MKTFSTFFLLMICSIWMNAQPVLTSSFNPAVNDHYKYHPVNTLITPGSAGANATWDFGAIQVIYNPVTGKYLNPSTTPYADSFPTATVAYEDHYAAGTYHYYTTSSSKLEKIGEASVLVTAVYENPCTIFSYPFTYATTVSTNYACTTSVGSFSLEKTATWEATGDAYGTLILPTGIYSNVLRIKTRLIVDDVYNGGGGSYQKDITEYSWVLPSSKVPLIKITSEFYYSGGTPIDTIESVQISEEVSGVASPELQLSGLNVYPNPATSTIQVDFQLQQEALLTLEVFNTEGKLLKTLPAENLSVGFYQRHLSTDDLLPGLYFVKVTAGEVSRLLRFVRI